MIRTDASPKGDIPSYFTLRNPSALLRDIVPGSVVRVSVLAALGDGTFRVSVEGRELIAAGLHGMAALSAFSARVRMEEGSLVLSPVLDSALELPAGLSPLFAGLGIPETPVSVFLVSFFRTIEMKLDPALLRSIMKTAARFPGRELRAAEAAAILSERGISADDEVVSELLDLIEGRFDSSVAGQGEGKRGDGNGAGSGETEDCGGTTSEAVTSAERRRSFCAFVNQKKGCNLHWIVLPFSQDFAGRHCSGSVRFLVDLAARQTAETRVSFFEGAHCWDFSIAGKACEFTAKPEFSPVVFGEFIVYLKCLMEKAGVETVSRQDGGSSPLSLIKSVNLEI
jgi:hypothetical protein